MRTVVVGYGSTLRSDDGIGPQVAQSVARLAQSTEVLVLERQTLTPDLASDIHDADRVIFIDASAEQAPGVIRERRIEPLADASVAMVHFLEPTALLEWCRQTFDTSPEAILITIGARSFELGETLSPEVQLSIPAVVRRTLELIAGAQ